MRSFLTTAVLLGLATCAAVTGGQHAKQPYRLSSVDLKQRIIWGAECRETNGRGLAFGGQDQDAEDGRPHTRVLENGQWKAIHDELRAANPLQPLHAKTWRLRTGTRNLLARLRYIYFQGYAEAEEAARVKAEVNPDLMELRKNLASLVDECTKAGGEDYEKGQLRFALGHLDAAKSLAPLTPEGVTAETIRAASEARIHLELAAEALDAEPPPRALDCGTPRKTGHPGPPAQGIAFDTKTGLYVIFAGDHLDYLMNDTWVFDPARKRWFQRHPSGAPPARANHRLEATGDGKIRMTGGYTYTSNTDYCGGQYADLDDGEWVYDVERSRWSHLKNGQSGRAELTPADSRVYRSGPFHPDFYLQGDKPSAGAFEAWLKRLPVNRWVTTDPPHYPRLNRDWGTARIDPDRDMILRWSGGHSAHGGTDVLHFHFSTNRWELPFPVEFPLGQLYSNTSYPNGRNFNLRPWMTGHTYQNYAYDPPSKKMVKAGRPRHYYVYDPDVGDWTGRGDKPAAMKYNGCFYTLTLAATPEGAVCWDKNGRVHRFDHAARKWIELEITGDKLPGAYVDHSTIAYDSKRDRVLIINTPGYRDPYSGQIWALDMKTHSVTALSPQAMEQAHRFATVDRCCYDATNDLLIMGTYLEQGGEHTPTPAYDCAENRWITLDIEYNVGKRHGNTTRAFPHARSDSVVFDPQRNLIWGTDTNSQVFVLRIDPKRANKRPL